MVEVSVLFQYVTTEKNEKDTDVIRGHDMIEGIRMKSTIKRLYT